VHVRFLPLQRFAADSDREARRSASRRAMLRALCADVPACCGQRLSATDLLFNLAVCLALFAAGGPLVGAIQGLWTEAFAGFSVNGARGLVLAVFVLIELGIKFLI
jgi:hypothetical protein